MKLKHLPSQALRYLTAPVCQNFPTFCFLYLLGLITLMIEVVGLNWKFPKFNLFSLLLDVYLICLLLTLVPRKIRRWANAIIATVLYALAVVDAFCVTYFHAVIGPEILNVVLETTGRESSEFVDKYIRPDVLFTGVGLVLLCAVAHLLSPQKKSPLSFFLSPPFSLLSPLFSLALLASFGIAIGSRINMVQLLLAPSVVELDRHVSNQSLNTPLNNLLFSIKMRLLANYALDDLTAFQEQATVDGCEHTSPCIVLIIGESYIKRHSQLYGYQRPTTPRQLAMMRDSSLTVFTDVQTPSNLTSTVFKHVFSLHSADDSTDWSRFPLFPVLFRKAGYQVTFLTNQFVKTVTQDAFNISGGLFLNHTRLSYLQFDQRNSESHQYDMDLLGDYRRLQQDTDTLRPRLIIFHLAGQHIDFYKRCPDSLRQFSAADYADRKDLNEGERQLVADYDNATYYNDMVVDSIVRTFAHDEAIVIYMPDHGEECFDELHRMGRLPQGQQNDPRVVRAEYEIPFWIWCSPAYCERHPQLLTQIRAARQRAFTTDNLPHMLLSLAGIRTTYYRPERDLLHPHYQSGMVRPSAK